MLAQEIRSKFDRDEAMRIAARPRGLQWRRPLKIEGERLRRKLNRLLRVGQPGSALKIQAQLQAAGMKTARPIELCIRREFVPLETESQFAITAKQRSPAVAYRLPGRTFRKGGIGAGGDPPSSA